MLHIPIACPSMSVLLVPHRSTYHFPLPSRPCARCLLRPDEELNTQRAQSERFEVQYCVKTARSAWSSGHPANLMQHKAIIREHKLSQTSYLGWPCVWNHSNSMQKNAVQPQFALEGLAVWRCLPSSCPVAEGRPVCWQYLIQFAGHPDGKKTLPLDS